MAAASSAERRGLSSLAVWREVHHAPRVALDRKWLHAQINLGFKLVVHYLAKLVPWSTRYGLERFQQNYVVEGLAPATTSFRALAHHAGRCTTCGECDRVCPLLDVSGATFTHDFMGPRSFVVAGARAAHLLDDVKDSLRILTSPTCTDCKKCEAACPEGIPILALAAGLKAQADVVTAAKNGQVPITEAEVKAKAKARKALPPSSSNAAGPG